MSWRGQGIRSHQFAPKIAGSAQKKKNDSTQLPVLKQPKTNLKFLDTDF